LHHLINHQTTINAKLLKKAEALIVQNIYKYLVLSDSRLGSVIPATENIFALVSTPDTINMIPAGRIRAQDAIGQGAIDFKLMVSAESGESIRLDSF